MEQVLLYKALVETELAKGQAEMSVLIDGEVYALRRRDTIREQDETIKPTPKLTGFRGYGLVHIAKAFERTVVYVGLSKSPRLAAELAWDPKPPDIVVGPSKPGSPSLVVDLKNSEGASHRS